MSDLSEAARRAKAEAACGGHRLKVSSGFRYAHPGYARCETAWKAVKEFIEREAALPTNIEWIAAQDLPPNTFPGPDVHPNALRR
jgi:hypothetical protein